MPLEQDISELTNKIKKTWTEPEVEEIQLSGKMVEIPLTPEGKAVETERLEALREILAAKTTEEMITLRGKYRDVALTPDDIEVIDKHASKLPEHKGNPIACATELRGIESDIAGGRTYWDIVEEQYNRWERGVNTCLPCERSYTEAKSALTGVGIRHSSVIHPKDLLLADIAASVRERTATELFIAEQNIRELVKTCGIKFPKVRSRITKMKPLAYVGRWDEFMEHQKQLLIDFELDVREVIPDLEVRIPSYEVPRVIVVSEYERIKAKLTDEQRAILEEKEKEEKRSGRIPAKWAAYKCPYCESSFPTIIEMHAHVQSKHKPYPCPYCKESFYTLDARIEHIRVRHPKEVKMPVKGGA